MQVARKKIQFIICLMSLIFFSGCITFTKGHLIKANIQGKYAFLVVDIQKDFMQAEGKLPIDSQQAKTILKTINAVVESIDANGFEIVYIGNEFSSSDWIANWLRNHAALKGKEGAKLDPRLNIVNNIYFSKDQPDAFSNDKFDLYLRNKKVNKLIIAGVFAGQCVLATARGALQRGYEVIVLSDGVGAKNDDNLKEALRKHKKDGTVVMSSAKFLESLVEK
ncbi:cysteine hydrolase family protein [Candidatus Margulisiibacteriota bacterium]